MFLLGTALLFTTSCSDDDNGGDISEDKLIGVWTLESTSVDVTIDGKSIVDYFVSMGIPQDDAEEMAAAFSSEFDEIENMSGTVEFKQDGTYVTNFGEGEDVGTWELNGNELLMDKDTADEETIIVKSLTDSELKVIREEEDEQDGVTITMKMSMTFGK